MGACHEKETIAGSRTRLSLHLRRSREQIQELRRCRYSSQEENNWGSGYENDALIDNLEARAEMLRGNEMLDKPRHANMA